jgi:hypothetical protein
VRPKLEKDIDFLFYGSITPYRQKLLERLCERGHRVTSVFDPRAIHRNDLIARTKVHVAPTQGPGMEHFAYGRVGYLLNNSGLVVVERCHDQEWLEHCFITATNRNWVDICEQTLLRNDRDMIREEFAERFRSLPFTEQMQRLLDESFFSPQKSSIDSSMPQTAASDRDDWRRYDRATKPAAGPHFHDHAGTPATNSAAFERRQ